MFASPFKLKKAGVVGMNRRNVVLIARNNRRELYPSVDDKLKTKVLLQKAGISAPRLLGVVKTQGNVRELDSFLDTCPPFVIKPSRGSGGKGILVISGRHGQDYLKPGGDRVTIGEIKRHASNTLSGLFSLGGHSDVAMIEEMVDFSDAFEGFSYQGVPDIRVIVYKGYPVMAMTRLSTAASEGKANLHQGAVGVGIDVGTGEALKAVQFSRQVTHHPDTGKELSTLSVPHWRDFLDLAARCYEITGLGYLGVDIVLDRLKGPMILELNARPGLAIQIANGHGLQPRVDRVDVEGTKGKNASERVLFSMEAFSVSKETGGMTSVPSDCCGRLAAATGQK
ncbi:alpha-L-glutamate ligase-like protein [Desulfoluna spongiiphila]|nr:alpha-L-glutamate ligase-like protein [Desulfoluna spongiiphila]